MVILTTAYQTDAIKEGESITDEPIGLEILAYHPGDNRFDAVSVELGQLRSAQ